MKTLGKYSIGLGDRFGHQGGAQLKAIIKASAQGINITPVWNKSNREHTTIGTQPGDVRKEADSVTKSAGFKDAYFVDADHINSDTVDRFIDSSDFFTICCIFFRKMSKNFRKTNRKNCITSVKRRYRPGRYNNRIYSR